MISMQRVGIVVEDGRRNALITELATAIERRKLTTPAILLLEANRPFSFIMSQLLLVAEPVLGLLFDAHKTREIALLLEDRDNVDLLLEHVEANR
jgi:hypothetical protein